MFGRFLKKNCQLGNLSTHGYVKGDSCGEDSALSCSSAFVSIIGLLALACSVHCIDMHSSIINYTSTKLALYYCDI